ncbi:MAG TPA: Gfo/Idh/MocA family oxidoreductase [Acidimicrobiia bacterium]|nr:Gfo/Idh/MocA family oxidoreductase [Acidimicrobiia bacterium]
MSNPKIAVIGLGFMGAKWSRLIVESGLIDLSVVSDVRTDVGEQLASAYGAEFTPDPTEAAGRADVDGVVVCTPEHLHVEASMTAIESGKALAVEKPIAHTLEDAERIREGADHAGIPVLVGHVLRFEPRYAAIRNAIATGEIGDVQAIRSERIGLIADQEILQARTSIALYYGVHEFDIARWYAGDVASLAAARSSGVVQSNGYDVEDLYSAVLTFRSGAHGTAMIGWSLPARTPGYGLAGFTVIGEHGVLQVRQGATGFTKVLGDGPSDADVSYAPEVHGSLYGALGIEVDHFARVVRGEVDPVCTARDGTEALKVSLAMEKAARTGEVVHL